jgi:hypothetical protein
MTPARMAELLNGQAAAIELLTAELAIAEAEADEQAQLVEKWAWIARYLDYYDHADMDIALEAWSDMRERQGNNT